MAPAARATEDHDPGAAAGAEAAVAASPAAVAATPAPVAERLPATLLVIAALVPVPKLSTVTAVLPCW